jgi:hypothetical protein
MRAHITTTTKSRPRRKARHSVLALALGVCALAIPASASGYSVNGIDSAGPGPYRGAHPGLSQPDGDGAVAAGNAHRTPTELAQTTAAGEPSGSGQPGGAVATDHSSPNAIQGGHDVIPGYASADAITGAEPFTRASGSPSGAEQWFDVPSALVGAGAAMALVALGGAAFLTVRRRTEVSPSAFTS